MNEIRKTLRAITLTAATLLTLTPMTAYATDIPCILTVKQEFIIFSGSPDATFNYVLKPLDSKNPMPSGSTAQGYAFAITGNGAADIGPIAYGEQGVYQYGLSQAIGPEQPGYVYDKRVYTIEVYVDGSTGVNVVAIDENGDKAGEIAFQNAYGLLSTDPGMMADPPVRKSVFGSPDRDSTFAFKLEALNPDNPMPAGSADGVKTITVTGSGQNKFGVWSYDKAGTYYYAVSEANTGERGYAYDTARYTITDMVREENGGLTLYRVVANESNKQVASLIFNNYYYPGGGTSPLYPALPPPADPPDMADSLDPGNPPTLYYPGIMDAPVINGPATSLLDPDPVAHSAPVINPSPDDGIDLFGDSIPHGEDVFQNIVGPKTGDETNTAFYTALLLLGFIAAVGAALFLIAGTKRERDR